MSNVEKIKNQLQNLDVHTSLDDLKKLINDIAQEPSLGFLNETYKSNTYRDIVNTQLLNFILKGVLDEAISRIMTRMKSSIHNRQFETNDALFDYFNQPVTYQKNKPLITEFKALKGEELKAQEALRQQIIDMITMSKNIGINPIDNYYSLYLEKITKSQIFTTFAPYLEKHRSLHKNLAVNLPLFVPRIILGIIRALTILIPRVFWNESMQELGKILKDHYFCLRPATQSSQVAGFIGEAKKVMEKIHKNAEHFDERADKYTMIVIYTEGSDKKQIKVPFNQDIFKKYTDLLYEKGQLDFRTLSRDMRIINFDLYDELDKTYTSMHTELNTLKNQKSFDISKTDKTNIQKIIDESGKIEINSSPDSPPQSSSEGRKIN